MESSVYHGRGRFFPVLAQCCRLEGPETENSNQATWLEPEIESQAIQRSIWNLLTTDFSEGQ